MLKIFFEKMLQKNLTFSTFFTGVLLDVNVGVIMGRNLAKIRGWSMILLYNDTVNVVPYPGLLFTAILPP